MIGLGGGSLVKFCHRYLPRARITVLENNPGVVALRKEFEVPDDDARLSVVMGDGAALIQESAATIDVLLVDGFDAHGQPAQLCSKVFYDHCLRALADGGVLVVNLHADDPNHDELIGRIADTFQGNAMQVLAGEKANCIVFAGRGRPVTLQALRSLDWASQLDPQVQRQLKGEFASIGWNARALAGAEPPRAQRTH
jgi:spermidine synthase